jgi:hypothetical protein
MLKLSVIFVGRTKFRQNLGQSLLKRNCTTDPNYSVQIKFVRILNEP